MLPASEWRAIGTGIRLVTSGEAGHELARTAVEAEIADLDLACSRFREDSELSELNRRAGEWVVVGPLLQQALEAALWAARATDGAVSPTVGRALRVAGYDRDFAAIPAEGAPIVLHLAPVPAWHSLEVDAGRGLARVAAGAEIDLGSTAKALGADRAAAAAHRAMGGGGVLVSLGGDIALAGNAPEGGWPILVAEDSNVPLTEPGTGGEVVMLPEGGLATSSTRVRRWNRGQVEMHHIIDPATGAPVDGPWRTASVAAATCLDANTAATSAIVKGAAAREWLEARGLPARLVDRAGTVVRVGPWPEVTA